MKLGVISSIAKDTGSELRGRYFVSALKKENVDVHYFKAHGKLKNLEYFVYIPINVLRSFYKKFNYFIALKPFPTGVIPLFVNKFFCGGKAIVDVDDLDHTYRTGLLRKSIEIIQKYLTRKADIVTCLDNKYLIKYLVNNWGIDNGKIIPIEQGVNLELFDPSKYKINRKKYGFSEKDKILCFTGHLAYTASEVLTLINMFGKIKKEIPNLKLLIVGGGVRLDQAKKLVREKDIGKEVTFTGQVEVNKIPEIVKMIDVCVCYYAERECNYYRNSMKVREYLAMGKLVVCTDVGDLKKFKNYTVQTKPNQKDFCKGIIKALKMKDSESIKKKRRKFVIENFSWENIAKKLIKKLR